MYWQVKDNKNKIYYMMYVNKNSYTKISTDDINKVLEFKGMRPTWSLGNNGNITCGICDENKNKTKYSLHQLIMNVHDKDLISNKESVDHINQDKLDNRKENLRIATQSQQNENRGKSERRCDANDLPKYVEYRKEIYNKEKGFSREFFVINHPKVDHKRRETSKSEKYTLKEKLDQAKLIIKLIEEKITETEYNKKIGLDEIIDLPPNITINNYNNKPCLFFDTKDKELLQQIGKRPNMKRTLTSDNLQYELYKFIEDINKKYKNYNFHIEQYEIKNKVYDDFIKEDNNKKIELPNNFSYYTDNKNTNYLQYIKTFTNNKEKIKVNAKVSMNMNYPQQNDFIKLINKIKEHKYYNYVQDIIINDEKYIIPNNILNQE